MGQSGKITRRQCSDKSAEAVKIKSREQIDGDTTFYSFLPKHYQVLTNTIGELMAAAVKEDKELKSKLTSKNNVKSRE